MEPSIQPDRAVGTEGAVEADAVDPLNTAVIVRRHLTLLFSDLSGSTRIAARLEAEDYLALLGRIRASYSAAIARHGGAIAQISGDGVLAIFGYPDSHEDAGRRAAEAALDIHAAVRHLSPEAMPLAMHSGIHSGLVLLRHGDEVRGRFEVPGDATNLAARLVDAAGRDEILVSEATLGPQRRLFVTSARLALPIKGRVQPLGAYRLLGRAAVRPVTARNGQTPFVGRRADIAKLEATFAAAREGRVCAAAITGPPGQGKTRLATELLARAAARGWEVHRGTCDIYLGGAPFHAVAQIFRSIVAAHDPDPHGLPADAADRALSHLDPALAAGAATIGQIAAPAGGRVPTVGEVCAMIRPLVAQLAMRRPVLMFFDDMQWADDATRQVIDVLRGLHDLPLMLLVANRDLGQSDAAMSRAEILPLPPLNEAEAVAAIVQLMPGIDLFAQREVLSYAGGNPLFLEELCHSVARCERSAPLRPGQRDAWLRALIESRFRRLAPVEMRILTAAAVIGNSVPHWLLARVSGHSEDDPTVQALAEQDFLFPADMPGRLRFKHGITREAIYDTIGLAERRALHRAAAMALHAAHAEGEAPDHEALAYHHAAAGMAEPAAHHAELAADRAMAASALDRAQALYRTTLGLLDQLAPSPATMRRWHAIVGRLGLVSVFDPSHDHLALFAHAVDRAIATDDQPALAVAEYWLGFIRYGLGDSHRAIEHCQRALAAAEIAGDDRLAVQVRAVLGQAFASSCQYERALDMLDPAIAIKDRHRSGARPSVGGAYALACRASVIGDQGGFAEAHAGFASALVLISGSGHPVEASVLALRSAVWLWQGELKAAEDAAAEAEAVAARVNSHYLYAMSRALGAYARWRAEPRPEPLAALVTAAGWLDATKRHHFASLNRGWLAEALFASGDIQGARHHAATALLRGRRGDRLGEAMAYRALARATPDRARGNVYLKRALLTAGRRQSAHEHAATQLCAAEIAFAHGDRAAAGMALDDAEAVIAALGMNWHRTQAARLRAVL